jgi:UDP-N-acetylmuramoyl-tripeptide--D-alanyl-D-alanine ligase
VGPVHLEHLKNIETVAMAKGELFKNVSPDACVVINQDDSFCSLLADRAGIDRKNRLTFGWKNSADIQVEKIKSTGLKGSEVWIRDHRNGSSIPLHLHLPLPGTHNIYNLLAAVSCALYLGVSKEEIIQGVNMIEPVGSRTRTCWLKGDRHIIDDCYNANPASMNASLGLLKSLKGDGKAIAVLGEMLELGPESDRAHYQLGQLAAQCEVQELFVVGEHAAQVAKGAKEGGIDEGQIHLIYEGQRGKPPDELMEVLSSRIREVAPVDCWILVKGSRGVALERVVAHLEGYFPREKENR